MLAQRSARAARASTISGRSRARSGPKQGTASARSWPFNASGVRPRTSARLLVSSASAVPTCENAYKSLLASWPPSSPRLARAITSGFKALKNLSCAAPVASSTRASDTANATRSPARHAATRGASQSQIAAESFASTNPTAANAVDTWRTSRTPKAPACKWSRSAVASEPKSSSSRICKRAKASAINTASRADVPPGPKARWRRRSSWWSASSKSACASLVAGSASNFASACSSVAN
mmetsp:Transcript_12108/g.32704  ORF Transcript_12108/g.32704 Transcript_12108/m.32704 type:complete len:238 (+) Transcript_12108:391-1104(+)